MRRGRAWNVGDDKLIKWRLLDTPKAIGHLQCQPRSSKPQLSSIIPVSKERKALFDCSSIITTTTVESAAQANGRKHLRRIERSSMADMEETTLDDGDDTNRITPPDRGWALPKERKCHISMNLRYNISLRSSMLQQRIRWKPEEVSAEMQRKNDLKDRFYFTPAEFLKLGLIRSFFSRWKAIREKQTETVVVDEVEEEDDDEFDDNQVVEETEQRNNLRNSMEISNEQASPPASSRNRTVSPDNRAGSTSG
ncbi:unnamed protein product [Didymodactylos carnosus]|uniref:Uncharacterized protein n=1 Tax=Didymodactylos carnosus TaxID=1234261 RepID=A0A814IY84_9BILA|nr:unnamed protein product [Didymodactylos carnosus]CAF3801626.1 unnamed protein product [Didymodactylos carnosus]